MGEASITREVGTPLDFELYQQLMAELNTATPQRLDTPGAALDPLALMSSAD